MFSITGLQFRRRCDKPATVCRHAVPSGTRRLPLRRREHVRGVCSPERVNVAVRAPFPGRRYKDWKLDDPPAMASRWYGRSASRSSPASASCSLRRDRCRHGGTAPLSLAGLTPWPDNWPMSLPSCSTADDTPDGQSLHTVLTTTRHSAASVVRPAQAVSVRWCGITDDLPIRRAARTRSHNCRSSDWHEWVAAPRVPGVRRAITSSTRGDPPDAAESPSSGASRGPTA